MQGTWSYDENEATDKDKVRGLIGDDDTNDQLLSDEKIGALLVSQGSVLAAAIACAEALAARFARKVNKSIGAASLSSSDLASHYETLAKRLRRNLASSAVPYLGGQSRRDKGGYEGNSDRVRPYFTRETFTLPGDRTRTLTEVDEL